MKTKKFITVLSLLAFILSPNFSSAQSSKNHNLFCTSSANFCTSEQPANDTAFPIDEIRYKRNTTFIIDESNTSLILTYSLPTNSYKAVLQIKDFNDKVIKTFSLNTLSKNMNEFYINDLLSGDYTCTLTIDEEKKSIGGFTIKE